MTSPVELQFNRARIKPVAGTAQGATPQVKPVASAPAAPLTNKQAEAPAGLTDAEKLLARRAALQAAMKAQADKDAAEKLAREDEAAQKEAAEKAAAEKAAETPPEPTGTAELPQAGEVPTAAPASTQEATGAPPTASTTSESSQAIAADVAAFLKAHPNAEALIEKLAAQGK